MSSSLWRVGVVAVLLTAACGSTPPAPTVKVDRGTVDVTVSASGTLVSLAEQNLGFADGGKLTEVLVKVGDRVTQGQVLARLDDDTLRDTLAQNQATLASEQSVLNRIRGGTAVGAASDTLGQAEKILDATKDQVEATDKADSSALNRARKQLDLDRDALDLAQDQLRTARSACAAAPPATASPTAGVAGGVTGGVTSNPACDQVATAETAVQQARGTVLSSQTAVDAAEQLRRTDAAAGDVSIERARQDVVAAQNDRSSASADRPGDIGEQAGKVRDAQAAVRLAQRDIDETVLRAPAGGVVAAINGAVGETVGAASAATSLAPGSGARLPDLSVPTGEGAGTPATPGAGSFMVLDDVTSLQLIVPFEESDAVRVTVNQPVEVSVDAVPGLTVPGTIAALAPTGESSSGIVNFTATIGLGGTDPRLRDGQTAVVSAVVESAENVLRVPTAVVRNDGDRRLVDTPGADGGDPVPVPFVPGLVGDEFIEVRSGLTEGQDVIRPQGTVTKTENQGGPGDNGPGG